MNLLCTDEAEHISGTLDINDAIPLIGREIFPKNLLLPRMTALGHNLGRFAASVGIEPSTRSKNDTQHNKERNDSRDFVVCEPNDQT